jgi:hypothetical protein
MSILASRAQRRQLERDNAKLPLALKVVPREAWPETAQQDPKRLRVWRSREWLVQEYAEDPPVLVRLSVNRTVLSSGRWEDGISWDDLQGLKSECGYSSHDAVEVYPATVDVVNVANMRHLWVLIAGLPYAWRGKR